MYSIVQTDVIYRSLKDPFEEGILACGFMKKPSAASSQINFRIDYYSCFLVLSGTGVYQDSVHGKIPLNSGDFVQRIPGLTHSTEIVADGNWTEFFISFGKPVYDYLCQLSMLNPNTPVQKGIAYPDDILASSFSHFLTQLKKADSRSLNDLLLSAQKLVLRIQEHARSSIALPQQDASRNQLMEEACHSLASHFQESINYQQLAHSLHMSYESFRKQFKSTTGMSPAKYRTFKKIKQAGFMIQSGLTIKEVTILTGYSDVFAFSKQFKKTTGVAPGKYTIFKQDQ